MQSNSNTYAIPALKYLFIVEYKDGSVYRQNMADLPVIKKTGSSFSDVRMEDVSRFYLVDAKNVFCVDLNDGHFEVNKIPFYMHDQGEGLKDFRLIFYRQHTHSFNIGTKEELLHEINYCLGWQTNNEQGNNIKRIMEIK